MLEDKKMKDKGIRFISVNFTLGELPVIIEGFVENGEVLGVRLLHANDGEPLTWALNNIENLERIILRESEEQVI